MLFPTFLLVALEQSPTVQAKSPQVFQKEHCIHAMQGKKKDNAQELRL